MGSKAESEEYVPAPMSPPATQPKQNLSGKARFRALVRFIINSPWIRVHPGIFGKMMHKKKYSMQLDLDEKFTLFRSPETRTAEEKEYIYNAISHFKFYWKHTEKLKHLLIENSQLVGYGPNRTIVRAGHYATAMYFIISGDLNLIEKGYDEYLKETVDVVIDSVAAGDIFGELCLNFDLPRLETIVSTTSVEFLMIRREIFDVEIKDLLMEEQARIHAEMCKFSYFSDWDKLRIGECCMQSYLADFKPGEIILGDGIGRSTFVHFVTKGRCALIEELHLAKEVCETFARQSFSKYSRMPSNVSFLPNRMTRMVSNSVSMPSVPSSSSTHSESEDIQQFVTGLFDGKRRQSTVQKSYRDSVLSDKSESSSTTTETQFEKETYDYVTTFAQVCLFEKMACFSVGESMKNRRVIAEEACTCLLIPASLLMGSSGVWIHVKKYILRHVPDTYSVMNTIMRKRQMRAYRSMYVYPLLNKNNQNSTGNIPYSIRIHEDLEYRPKAMDLLSRAEVRKSPFTKSKSKKI